MAFPVVSNTVITLGVFIGIIVSMFWYERELLTPGGVVVPGYTALFLITDPLVIAYTLATALLTAVIIRYASRLTILYGRRRFAITMLTALSLTFAIQPIFGLLAYPFPSLFQGSYSQRGFQVIGIIIPGLIANEVHRQGVIPTLATLGIVSAITAMILYGIFIFM